MKGRLSGFFLFFPCDKNHVRVIRMFDVCVIFNLVLYWSFSLSACQHFSPIFSFIEVCVKTRIILLSKS